MSGACVWFYLNVKVLFSKDKINANEIKLQVERFQFLVTCTCATS